MGIMMSVLAIVGLSVIIYLLGLSLGYMLNLLLVVIVSALIVWLLAQ